MEKCLQMLTDVPRGTSPLVENHCFRACLITTTHPAFPGSQRCMQYPCVGLISPSIQRTEATLSGVVGKRSSEMVLLELNLEGLHTPRQRTGKDMQRRRTHMYKSMQAREGFKGWQFAMDPSLPSLAIFLFPPFKQQTWLTSSCIILTFSQRCCISQDGLVYGAVTNSPTSNGLWKQRFISCVCCIPDLGQPWPLLHVVLTPWPRLMAQPPPGTLLVTWRREQEYDASQTGLKALAQRSSMNHFCSLLIDQTSLMSSPYFKGAGELSPTMCPREELELFGVSINLPQVSEVCTWQVQVWTTRHLFGGLIAWI